MITVNEMIALSKNAYADNDNASDIMGEVKKEIYYIDFKDYRGLQELKDDTVYYIFVNNFANAGVINGLYAGGKEFIACEKEELTPDLRARYTKSFMLKKNGMALQVKKIEGAINPFDKESKYKGLINNLKGGGDK